MEQETPNGSSGEERDPREIVETYCPPTREVVETYVHSRPLPGHKPAAKSRFRGRTGLWIFLACVLLAAGLSALAWLWGDWSGWDFSDEGDSRYEETEQDQGVHLPVWRPEGELTFSLTESRGPELTPQEIYRRVNPSVATVQVELDDGGAVGTGVIFTEDGYLLTNYHVVEGSRDCKVLLADNSVWKASYVTGDRDNDLAVLKIDGDGLPAAEIGDSDTLSVGDKVYAIGNPLGVELRGTFTDGIVSAINRSVSVDGRNMTLIQTNAALNSGNSGGPLVNASGQVVGINTIKMSSSFSSIEGLGFAIPTRSIREILDELLAVGAVRPEPVLGLSVSQVGDPLPDGSAGLLVQSVTQGGAAELAGVRAGDYILEADGESITVSSDLLRIRRRFRAGDRLELLLWRDGERISVTLELQQPEP